MSDFVAAVKELARAFPIRIQKVQLDEEHFGDASAVLSLSEIDLRFARDKGELWSEILVPSARSKWYLYGDVMNVLKIPFEISSPNDLSPAMNAIVNHLCNHLREVQEAFGSANREETALQLDRLVQCRVSKTFGLNTE